ncbi:SH3 domain-containing protein [Hoeflea poritis]|uniref:SH3 domain-containing protein n=1 Tax=Hoeflea poritis TaxID=2993659 RepID=A0ABT4VS50_9HYPH|nr:SH3 domain-containing protein [Hoeflea poritis]MDA4846848.1 SH3 domain-containing protein [Hoeflea poritis]
MRGLLIVLCIGLLGLPGIAWAQGQALYDEGKFEWERQSWPAAYSPLREYRLLNFGRRPDVDYMLGTSGCRIDGLRTFGINMLNAMLYVYPLTAESRAIVQNELRLCRGSGTGTGTGDGLQLARIDWPPAGVSVVFKVFYWDNDTQPVTSYPMRRVENFERSYFTRRRVPLDDEEAAYRMAEDLSPAGRAWVSGRLILISESDHQSSELKTIASTLNRYLDFLSREYGIGNLDHYVTVHLVGDRYHLQDRARDLHGLDVSAATLGYAYADDLSLIAYVPGTATGTVLHELFHLMVRSEYGNIPQWLDEGIASLYEVSVSNGDRYWGVHNWRGEVLERLWDEYRPSVEQLIRSDWYLFDDPAQVEAVEAAAENPDELIYREEESARQAAMMATARYFALYLQENGQLKRVFQEMKQSDLGVNKDREVNPRDQAVAVVRASLGNRSLEKIDEAFADWFLSGGAEDAGRPRDATESIEKAEPGQIHKATAAVNIRRGPGTAFDRIGGLATGDRVAVVSVEDGWAAIRLKNGGRGYVSVRYLEQLP